MCLQHLWVAGGMEAFAWSCQGLSDLFHAWEVRVAATTANDLGVKGAWLVVLHRGSAWMVANPAEDYAPLPVAVASATQRKAKAAALEDSRRLQQRVAELEAGTAVYIAKEVGGWWVGGALLLSTYSRRRRVGHYRHAGCAMMPPLHWPCREKATALFSRTTAT